MQLLSSLISAPILVPITSLPVLISLLPLTSPDIEK